MQKDPSNKKEELKIRAKSAFIFILLMGLVSMMSDIVHEGANSILGAFESFVGVSPFYISLISGLGMFIGYSLRLFTGYLADKTKKYWLFTIVGYVLDLISIPLLALVPKNGWILACCFILLERVGKAIKKPAKNALISFAAKENGTGKTFAFSELLDQLGAFLGPIILTSTYLAFNDLNQYDKYRIGFLFLGIPALICFILLFTAKIKYPHPEIFEKEESNKIESKKFSKIFVLLLIASSFMGFGFVDFPLYTSHVASLNLFNIEYLPLLYSYAMLIDAISAMVFGLLYDKKGNIAIIIATLLSAPSSFFFLLFNSYWSIFLGVTLWGIGMGSQESVMLSIITDISKKENRSKAFGIFDICYGLFWFIGSMITGCLYTCSYYALCILSTSFITLSAIIFIFATRYANKNKKIDNN